MEISFGDSANDLWLVGSTLFGALVGAISSGLVTFVLEALKRRDERAARAAGIGIKLKLLTDAAYTVHKGIKDTLQAASAKGIGGLLLNQLRGLRANDVPAIHFDLAEMNLLVSLKMGEELNKVVLFAQRQRTLEVGLSAYGADRERLFEGMAVVGTKDGKATVEIASDDHRTMARLGNLEDQAKDLIRLASEQVRNGVDLMDKVPVELRNRLRNNRVPIFQRTAEFVDPTAEDA